MDNVECAIRMCANNPYFDALSSSLANIDVSSVSFQPYFWPADQFTPHKQAAAKKTNKTC